MVYRLTWIGIAAGLLIGLLRMENLLRPATIGPPWQLVLVAALLASVACGVIGSYVVAKRISSLCGGLAHAAFGGVGLGYLLGFSPMLGAAGAASEPSA